MSVAFSYLNRLEDADITTSSEQASFPASNIIHPFRSKVWRTVNGQIVSQYVEFDCHYQIRPTMFAMVNEQRGVLLSKQAIIKLQYCNDGNWGTAGEIVIPWHESLITKQSLTPFASARFWRLSISDANNVDNYIEIGYAYLGETVQFDSSDVAIGWGDAKKDNSDRVESDGGEPWFDEKTQQDVWSFDLPYMTKADRDNFEEMVKYVGKHKPFFLHLDPCLKISANQSELTRFVRFENEPEFTNDFLDAYSTKISVLEAI